jgi:uncharacterized damage-inducible protein DinB
MIERFRRWFAYEMVAQRKALASLRSVPESGRADEAFQKAVDILAHTEECRRVWLARFGVIDMPEVLYPGDVSLDEIGPMLDQVETEWTAWFAQADDDLLGRSFEYASYLGGHYVNTYEDVLTQSFGHAWYHRGQIASLVAQCGGTPAITDYIFETRRPVADATA